MVLIIFDLVYAIVVRIAISESLLELDTVTILDNGCD